MELTNPTLTTEQKQHIKDLYKQILLPSKTLNPPDNILLKNLISSDDYSRYQKVRNIYQQSGYFYERLFAYLCNFQKPNKTLCHSCSLQKSNKNQNLCETCNKNHFDLIDNEDQIYIELKSNFNTDNHNARDSKFHHLGKYKQNHPDATVIYACINDNRKRNNNVYYTHHLGFIIMTGDKTWDYFCEKSKD